MSAKRFPATARKLRQARENGDVAKSPEFTACCGIAGGLFGALFVRTRIRTMLIYCSQCFPWKQDLALNDMIVYVLDSATLFVGVLVLVLCSCFFAVLIGEVAQVGFVVSVKPLAPDFSRLSVAQGLQKLFGVNQQTGIWQGVERLVDLSKRTVATMLVFCVTATILASLARALAPVNDFYEEDLYRLLVAYGGYTVGAIFGITFFLGVIDLIIAKKRRGQRLRMDEEEFRRDLRESEGDPTTKALRKQLFLQLLFHGLITGIRKARVLVVGRQAPEWATSREYGSSNDVSRSH